MHGGTECERGQSRETGISWEAMYDFVLSCGNVHDIKDFCKEIVHRIGTLVPYDQARIYFLNGNGKVSDQYLVGVDKKWANAYHEYYSKIENGRYAIPSELREDMPPYSVSRIHGRAWDTVPKDEFIRDYVSQLGLKYSIGFTLFDTKGVPRTNFMLDRTRQVPFSDQEVRALDLVVPQLNNLHKNFFSQHSGEKKLREISWETTELTAREIEIANLLCHGVKPTNISKKLNITPSTTYKHISHIYEKMHVSSKQELLVKLLNG